VALVIFFHLIDEGKLRFQSKSVADNKLLADA
jgi:hypothetical protein